MIRASTRRQPLDQLGVTAFDLFDSIVTKTMARIHNEGMPEIRVFIQLPDTSGHILGIARIKVSDLALGKVSHFGAGSRDHRRESDGGIFKQFRAQSVVREYARLLRNHGNITASQNFAHFKIGNGTTHLHDLLHSQFGDETSQLRFVRTPTVDKKLNRWKLFLQPGHRFYRNVHTMKLGEGAMVNDLTRRP